MYEPLSFAYERCTSDLTREVGRHLVSELRSKHVMCLDSEKAERLYEYSNDAGYPEVMWGHGEGLCRDYRKNRDIQIGRIQRMIYKANVHPIRVVLDSHNIMWVDNLHSAIAHELCRYDCRLSNVPHYIVMPDDRYTWRVVDPYNLVDFSRMDGMLEACAKRLSRVTDDIRDVGYTIGEFIDDNGIWFKYFTFDCKTQRQIEFCRVAERLLQGCRN